MRDLARLPKAHLHLHLNASLRPETLRELGAAAGVAVPASTTCESFAEVVDVVSAAASAIRSAADVGRVLDEIAEDAAHDGAVWIEVSVSSGSLGGDLGSPREALEIVLEAAQEAAAHSGVGVGVIVGAHRNLGPRRATETALLVAEYAGSVLVGFGLDGHEVEFPAALFTDAFAIAREAGLMSVPHAGEFLGAASVADALDLLGATRVMHGVRAIEDPALLQRLAREDICLDVCPTSNVLMSVVPSLERHPLPALLSAGVRCSINADDPLPFDTSLLREYELCRDVLGLTDGVLASVARTSIRASAAPSKIAEPALAEIAVWLDAAA